MHGPTITGAIALLPVWPYSDAMPGPTGGLVGGSLDLPALGLPGHPAAILQAGGVDKVFGKCAMGENPEGEGINPGG